MTLICVPSYLGGGDKRQEAGCSLCKVSERSYLKNKVKKDWGCGSSSRVLALSSTPRTAFKKGLWSI
jgi:hypothetical protein